VEPWQNPSQEENQDDPSRYIVATGADRQVHLFKTDEGNDVVTSFAGHSDSPVLSYAPIQNGKYVLMTNMSGQLLLQRGAEILSRRNDHAKYAVKVIAYEEDDQPGETTTSNVVWVATAGWDSKILLYRLSIPSRAGDPDSVALNEPIAHINLPTNPESILFVRHPDTHELILLASRRDSTYLFYYAVPSSTSTETSSECKLLGKQNLAPHSNAWVAFSPSCLALSPHDPGLIAVAASTLPHMKVIIVRLLFPKQEQESSGPPPIGSTSAEQETQATQAFAALALQNREDAAIMIQANTFAPQTVYSTPQVVWRPDGSGVWLNGDDGVIRGVETMTGKVTAMLKDGHQVGSKVRAIWAGWVEVQRDGKVVKEEWLVSGGFDKRLIVWRV
jgi:WD40 repeat protein